MERRTRVRAHRRFAALFVFVSLIPALVTRASAQDLATQWPGLRPSQLQTVWVTNHQGDEVRGRLLALGPDTLTLLVGDEEQHIDRTAIARIERRDSLKNGAIAGAVVGVIMGLVSGGLADCPDGSGSSCRTFRLAILPLSTAVYTGVGVAIDASTPGRTVVYDAARRDATRVVADRDGRFALTRRFSW